MCGLELQFGIQAFRTCLGQHDHYLNHTGVKYSAHREENIFQNETRLLFTVKMHLYCLLYSTSGHTRQEDCTLCTCSSGSWRSNWSRWGRTVKIFLDALLRPAIFVSL